MLGKLLRILARATIRRYKPVIVGVTGNVGKTSTKLAIGAVLSRLRRIRASAKSFNNEIGFPLAILGDWQKTGGVFFWMRVILASIMRLIVRTRRYPEVLVLEYGVDRPGDMDYLLSIARPDVAVVTAIGDVPVHVEFFAGKEQVVKEKAKLVRALSAASHAVLAADDSAVAEMAKETRAHILTYGFDESAAVRVSSFEQVLKEMQGSVMKLEYRGNFIPVRIEGALGKAQSCAAAAAGAVGLIFSMNLVSISEALNDYRPPQGRLRVLRGVKKSLLIDDTYNASPLAMEEALRTLAPMKKRRIAVLGDMLELGKYTLEAHERSGKLAAHAADMLITVGLRGKLISAAALTEGMDAGAVHHFETVGEAGKFLEEKLKAGDVVLLKASQAVRLEKAVKEVMAEPERARELLVRQDARWLQKKGMYE